MTALVLARPDMPGYNSLELDEAHTPSRYCPFFSIGRPLFVFSHALATYLWSLDLLSAVLLVNTPPMEAVVENSPEDWNQTFSGLLFQDLFPRTFSRASQDHCRVHFPGLLQDILPGARNTDTSHSGTIQNDRSRNVV